MTFARTAIIFLILVSTWGITLLAGRTEDIRPNIPFENFPDRIGEWQGARGAMTAQIIDVLGVEDYILSDYQKSPRQTVNLYVGFYQSQREGDLIHSPKNCMPGAGWRIVATGIETFPHHKTGEPVKAIKLDLAKGSEKQIVLYWFQSRGRIITSEYWQKIWLVLDAMFRRRTDGSFVRLISPVVTSEQAALDLLKEFARQAQPYLDAFIPS